MTRHVVFGCNGPVGVELMHQLSAQDHEIVGVCRSGRSERPAGAVIVAADAADRQRAAEIARGADVVHCAVGLDYRQWTRLFPSIVDGVLGAAESAGARLVFADNVYCYGPQEEPLREDMPLTDHGRKPALRARLVETLLDAHGSGRVSVAIVRASDFFGPRVRHAMLGERVFPAALKGEPASVLGDPDLPHTYTYVPDLVRAMVAVSEDEGAFGRAWHAPGPPTRSTREVIEEIYRLAGNEARIRALPGPVLSLLAWFSPLMRELKELRYQWTRPLVVDSSRIEERYGLAATDWMTALEATIDWYRRQPR